MGPGIEAKIAADRSIHSDHKTLRITLPGGRGARYGSLGRFKMETLDEARYAEAIKSATPALRKALNACNAQHEDADNLHDKLDDFASLLTCVIRAALETSAKRSSGKALGYEWWDPECQAAARSFHYSRRTLQNAFNPGLPGEREQEHAEAAQGELR